MIPFYLDEQTVLLRIEQYSLNVFLFACDVNTYISHSGQMPVYLT